MSPETDYRALCAELIDEWDAAAGDQDLLSFADAIDRARTALAQPESVELPPDYIDAEHSGSDRKMLEVFYRACRSEGGTADEIHLRGIKAVMALALPVPVRPPDEGDVEIDWWIEGRLGFLTVGRP